MVNTGETSSRPIAALPDATSNARFPRVRILSRYLLARFLSWFAIILVVLLGGVLIAEMLLHLDDLSRAADGVGEAVRFLVVKVCAYYLPSLLSMAAFIAAFMSMGLAARWLEVTAAKAGGVSPLRLAVPVLTAAAALSLVALIVNETIVIRSERAWRRHESGASGDEMEFRRGSFWHHTGNTIFNVGDADAATRTIHNVTIFQLDDEGRLLSRIDATVGKMLDAELELFDATVRRFQPQSPLEPPARQWQQRMRLETDARADPTLLEADPATLSLANLAGYIGERAERGGDVARPRALFHKRLTEPVSVFLLALLAVPFALRVETTRSLAVQALGGVVLMLAFWFARGGGVVIAPSGALAAAAAPWGVVALFASFGAFRLARVPR